MGNNHVTQQHCKMTILAKLIELHRAFRAIVIDDPCSVVIEYDCKRRHGPWGVWTKKGNGIASWHDPVQCIVEHMVARMWCKLVRGGQRAVEMATGKPVDSPKTFNSG